MKFPTPLIPGILEQRYKRFLADVRLDSGETITVHCPNPGAMLGLKAPGAPVWISDSGNPKRKLRHTLELMQPTGPSGPVMVGINTMHPNKLAEEAILEGRIPDATAQNLAKRGHKLNPWPDWEYTAGAVCTIVADRETGVLTGASDPRRPTGVCGW